MAISFNFKKGIHSPAWEWLPFYMAGPSYHGTACTYNQVTQKLYWCIQRGTTATSASTTEIWEYDCVSQGWMLLASTTAGNRGIDIEYDPVRNVLYIVHGAALTSWQVFNLGVTSVTIGNVVCAARAITTMTTILPAAADYGANLILPDDSTATDPFLDTGITGTGSTTTSIIDNLTGKESTGSYTTGLLGCYVEFTSGALSGQRRLITGVPNGFTLTTLAFGSAPTALDTFNIVLPKGTATSGSVSTVVMTGAGWTVNKYAFSDVEILSGTGAGQRRRIASNTADTLTLATAVTGNARTGNWTTAPDATSVFRIVPSSDFVYYQPGTTSNTIYRLDVVQTTGTAWSASLGTAPAAPGGGSMMFHPHTLDPFSIYRLRGNGGNNLYRFNIGTAVHDTITTYWGAETINIGASATMMHGKRRIWIQKESSKRSFQLNLVTGLLEAGPTVPYAAPSAYDGKRSKYLETPDGAQFLYHLRTGGQEFFRCPIEWV